MPKKVSDTERILDFGLNATEDALNGAIAFLTAIRKNKFPAERKPRKRKAKTEPKEPEKPKARAKAAAAEPDWLTRHPEPEDEA